jgi:WD40 repeat protein
MLPRANRRSPLRSVLFAAVLGVSCLGLMTTCVLGAPTERALPEMNQVWALAISPDSKTVAAGGDGETVSLWDVETGEARHVLPRQTPKIEPMPKNYVMSMAFSPNGKELAVGYNDGAIVLWNQENQAVVNTGRVHNGSVHSLAFSPDGKWMASGSNSGGDDIVKIWDAATGKQVGFVEDLKWRAEAVAFSPDSKYFACGTADGSIVLLEIEKEARTVLHQPVAGGGNYAWSLAFSPDSSTVAAATYDNEIKRWDVQTKQAKPTWMGSGKANDGITSVTYSPDGKRVLISNGSNLKGPLEIRDADTGAIIEVLAEGMVRGTGAYSPDGRFIAVGNRGKSDTLSIWTLE